MFPYIAVSGRSFLPYNIPFNLRAIEKKTILYIIDKTKIRQQIVFFSHKQIGIVHIDLLQASTFKA